MRKRLCQFTLILAAILALASMDVSFAPGRAATIDGEVARSDLKSRGLGIAAIAEKSPESSQPRSFKSNNVRLASDLPGKKVPYAPVCEADFYYNPGTGDCIRYSLVKAGYNPYGWCFGDTGIGYTITGYTGGISSGGGTVPGFTPQSTWNISNAIEHYWTPALRTSVFGTSPTIPIIGPDVVPVVGNLGGPVSDNAGGGTAPDYSGGYGGYKPDYKIDLRESWGSFGTGTAGKYGSLTPDLNYHLNSGSLQYQNYTDWTKPTGSQGGKPIDIIRQGLNYHFNFDDQPKTGGTVKIPGGYVPGGYFKIPGTDQVIKIDRYQTGWSTTDQLPTGFDLQTSYAHVYATKPGLGWSEWDTIRDAHFGDTYDVSFDNDDGTEDRYQGFYDENGNYHEKHSYNCSECGSEFSQTEYVFDGDSMALIGSEHKEWENSGVYTDTEVFSGVFGWVEFHNYSSYFDRNMMRIARALSVSSDSVKIAQTFAGYLEAQPVLYLPTDLLSGVRQKSDRSAYRYEMGFLDLFGPTAGGIDFYDRGRSSTVGLDTAALEKLFGKPEPDVVPVVGDLGGPVEYDFDVGAPYMSRYYRGIPGGTTTPDAKVSMQIDQAGPGSDTADKNRDTKGKGPSPVGKPPVALKLFTNKPGLPIFGKSRQQNDVGFDQSPAACVADQSGGCTITVASSERRFYGLGGNDPNINVSLKVPYATAIVWREADGSQTPTTESIRQRMPSLPPEVRAKPRQFSIGDKKFTQAMIEAATFNPSPDRWKDYLQPAAKPQPAAKSKRGDKGGGPMDSFAQVFVTLSDDCATKEPAAYVEGQPLTVNSAGSRELPGATIHLEAVR
jgi:hypothetical protein